MIELLVLGAIVYAIVAAVKRRRPGDMPERNGVGVGRTFRYLMLLIALLVAAIGLTNLLGMAMETADARRGVVAVPLAMSIVALPTFGILAAWVWRLHRDDPTEREAPSWSLYLTVALVVTLAVAIGNAFAVADRVVAAEWRGAAVAGLLVWGFAWAGHWWAWRTWRPVVGPNVQLWLGSGIGLWVGAVSAAVTINLLVRRLFDAASDVAVSGDTSELALAAAGIAIGGIAWAWHWLRHGLGATRSGGWHVYVLLLGVFTGLAAAVAGAGYGLYVALEWWFGEPSTTSAVIQFRELAAPIGAVVVGMAVWAYHRSLVAGTEPAARTEVHRAYDYLVSAIALGTVAVALVILVVALFSTAAPASDAGDGAGVNTLLAAVTLLPVGAPMWATTWLRVQHTCAASEAETASPSRRRYLFAIFGVGGAVAFGAMISLLIVLFEAMLGEWSGGALADDVDLPAALLATTGLIATYHWLVYRRERHVAVRLPTRDVLLVCDGGAAIDEIATRTHSRVRVLHRTDVPPGTHVDLDEVVDAIDHATGAHLLVIAGNGHIQVVPYD